MPQGTVLTGAFQTKRHKALWGFLHQLPYYPLSVCLVQADTHPTVSHSLVGFKESRDPNSEELSCASLCLCVIMCRLTGPVETCKRAK